MAGKRTLVLVGKIAKSNGSSIGAICGRDKDLGAVDDYILCQGSHVGELHLVKKGYRDKDDILLGKRQGAIETDISSENQVTLVVKL